MVSDFKDDTAQTPAYDLRQIYAALLGEHLLDAAEARKSNRYYDYYKALEDIKTITAHKFKKKEEALLEYKRLLTIITILATKNQNIWLGKSFDPNINSQIETALRDLEEFLYSEMEDAKLFGEGWRIPGL